MELISALCHMDLIMFGICCGIYINKSIVGAIENLFKKLLKDDED